MTQKEKLIDIISNYDSTACSAKEFAEYLINNGVVVLPCKVGDRLFRRSGEEYAVYELEIKDLYILESNVSIFAHPILPNGEMGRSYECFWGSAIGHIVFLTREEAEAALKGEKKQ